MKWARVRDRFQSINEKADQWWDSRSWKAKAALIAGSASLALGSFFAADAFLYRQALQDAGVREFQQSVEDDISATMADASRYRRCIELQPQHQALESDPDKQAYRECLTQAAAQLESHTGALMMSLLFFDWLLEHGDDEQVREAGINMIANGRMVLAEWRENILKPSLVMRDIQSESLTGLLRAELMGHSYLDASDFSDLLAQLNIAEFRMHVPDVARKQNQWVFDYHHSQE